MQWVEHLIEQSEERQSASVAAKMDATIDVNKQVLSAVAEAMRNAQQVRAAQEQVTIGNQPEK